MRGSPRSGRRPAVWGWPWLLSARRAISSSRRRGAGLERSLHERDAPSTARGTIRAKKRTSGPAPTRLNPGSRRASTGAWRRRQPHEMARTPGFSQAASPSASGSNDAGRVLPSLLLPTTQDAVGGTLRAGARDDDELPVGVNRLEPSGDVARRALDRGGADRDRGTEHRRGHLRHELLARVARRAERMPRAITSLRASREACAVAWPSSWMAVA